MVLTDGPFFVLVYNETCNGEVAEPPSCNGARVEKSVPNGGGVPERSNGSVSKTDVPSRVP